MENKSDEIDLIEIIKIVYRGKFTITIISAFFITIGVGIALLSDEIYTSSTTFITNNPENNSGSRLGGVASLVGINLGGSSNTGEIPTLMYPQVAQSVEFKRLLINGFVDEKEETTMKEFMMDYYDVRVESENKSTNNAYVSVLEDLLFQILDKKILSVGVDQKDGFITISVNMPNSEYAANTCVNAREILQEIIINNKIQSSKQNLSYSQEQLKSKRLEFEEIQNKLAFFNDSNLNMVSSSMINERDKLEADFQIMNAVIVELSKQVEENKLQVSKDTPVFSIVKEASMPVSRSYPKRTQLVLTFGVFGVIFSIIYVIIKKPLLNLFEEIKSWKESLKNLFFS